MTLALLRNFRSIKKLECYSGVVLESSGLLLKEKAMSDWMFNCKEGSQIDCLFSDVPALSRCAFRIYEVDKYAQFDILFGGSNRERRREKFYI